MKFAKLAPWLLMAVAAPRVFALSPMQKTELYQRGTIGVYSAEGERKGHFEVRFMPGAEAIKHDRKAAMDEAYRAVGELVDSEGFWHGKVERRYRDGVSFMRRHVVDQGIVAVPGDFMATRRQNAQLDGEFGAGAGQVRNWVGFGGRTLGKVMHTLIGGFVGAAYAVVAPVGTIVLKPVEAGAVAALGGVVFPAVRYAWNGAAWVMVKDTSEPTRPGMTVTYVAEAE